MSFTSITVTGKYVKANTVAASGTVQFALASVMVQPTEFVAISPITVTLDGTGSFSVALIANDDTSTTSDIPGYYVIETVGGATRTYRVLVPSAAPGGTINLAALSPL